MSDVATETVSRRPLWQRYVLEVKATADAESTAALSSQGQAAVWLRAGAVIAVGVVSLVLIQLLKRGTEPGWLIGTFDAVGAGGTADRLEHALLRSEHAPFNRLVLWSIVQISGYVVLPAILITVAFRHRLADYGTRLGPGAGIYLLLFLAIIPLVVMVSFTAPFQETYPFYRLAPGEGLWPRMTVWWLLYAGQFAALEFFFRGFFLHGLKPALGYAAVYVMIVPYVLIHLQKPLLEIFGAVGAGFVLGTLALKTKTIWWGAAVHIAVALVMDLASLAQQDLL